jgi:hypothetical protein
MTLTRRSHCRREGSFDHGRCVGPAAAILVHELPVKFCQGHPRILDWEKKDFSRKLVTQKSTWDYEKMKFGFFFWPH